MNEDQLLGCLFVALLVSLALIVLLIAAALIF